MRDRILRFALLVAGVVLVANATAMADWTTTLNTNNAGPFTQIQAFIDTPGVDFTSAFTGLSCGWTSTQVNAQFVEMSGPSSCGNFNFKASFTGSSATPFTIDWDIWNGSTLDPFPDSGFGTWNGSSWIAKAESPEDNRADLPEPSTLLLGAIGLVGVGVLRQRRRYC